MRVGTIMVKRPIFLHEDHNVLHILNCSRLRSWCGIKGNRTGEGGHC